jgi:two-component system LytT family response regulator
MKLRVLIVDDEPLARRRVRDLLARDAEIAVCGECGDGEAAVRAIETLSPDLLLLDVQMPGCDGFEVLQRLQTPPRAVLFVTAYEEHALRAFEVQAVDYLLKPFSEARFAQAMERAKERARSQVEDERVLRLLRALRRTERIVVRDGGRVAFVPVDELDWARAAGNYVELHARGATHLLRETLTALAARLDPVRFGRVHRSTLVNLERVREVRPLGGGDHELILIDGTRLTLSRTHRDLLDQLRRTR